MRLCAVWYLLLLLTKYLYAGHTLSLTRVDLDYHAAVPQRKTSNHCELT